MRKCVAAGFFLWTLIPIFLSAHTAGNQAERTYLIKEIRVFGHPFKKRSILFFYLTFAQGKKYTLNSLKNRIQRSREILDNTFYFDRVEINYIHSRKDPDSIIIFVETQDGFRWHLLSGRDILSFGRRNIGKRNLAVYSDIGTWYLGGSIVASFMGGSPFTGRISGLYGWNFSQFYPDESFQERNIEFSLGVDINLSPEIFITPGFRWRRISYHKLEIGSGTRNTFIFNEQTIQQQFMDITLEKRNSPLYPTRGWYLFGEIARDVKQDFFSYQVEGRSYIPCRNNLSLAMRAVWKKSQGGIYYARTIDLYRDAYLRRPDQHEFRGSQGYKINLEMRQGLARMKLPDIWLEGIFFFDYAQIQNQQFSKNGAAYGLGLRLHIPNPLFYDIGLEYALGPQSGFFLFLRRNF